MKLTIERLEMSGKGKKILWCIKNKDTRIFKTENGGFVSWQYKKHAKMIIERIEKEGLEAIKAKLDYKWE